MEKLSSEEYNLLNKLATKSKMDCWFYIDKDKNGNDYILDLESGECKTLYDGINEMAEGLTSLDDYDLSMEEKLCFTTLMYKLELSYSNNNQRLKDLLYNAIIMLEEVWQCGNFDEHNELNQELGITEEEYIDIMGQPFPFEEDEENLDYYSEEEIDID